MGPVLTRLSCHADLHYQSPRHAPSTGCGKRHWHEIEHVARLLIEHETVTREQARNAIIAAVRSPLAGRAPFTCCGSVTAAAPRHVGS
jgi:hypothetical protein